MFAYMMIGTNDREKAVAFYDALMPELGLKRFMDFAHITFYGKSLEQPFLGVCTPLDRNDASIGNGSMIALAAGDPETVDRVYHKALELGAECEGKPGVRPAGFYCAYFRDLDGNKFNVCCPALKK
ncbi:MAG: VOC family protein [Candidatus Pelagadaptatus aseana]|uniref:VOC family protein n=1 Tax=Candidatus Pelagadaptatus aseana TaxID=3120508 RepID=UPI0039B27EE1